MHPRHRMVFLFGPDAMLPWNAPTTDSLTKLILNKGFRKKDNTTITSLIYTKLMARDNKKKITYETILHFIDQLYNYANMQRHISTCLPNAQNETPQEPHSLDETEIDIHFFAAYDIADINDAAGTYSMIIPGFHKNKEYNIPIKTPPLEKYFELLYADLINHIILSVSKYSYHTEGRDIIMTPENKIMNELFVKYFKLITEHQPVRMYSLGYDRLFKILLSNAKVPVFEGFDVENSYVKYNETLVPDTKRITTDFDCHCFYNLHGSAYWKIDKPDRHDQPDRQLYLTADANRLDSATSINLSTDRNMIASNILTGYHEAQKIHLSPYRQMYAAFERDCLSGDIIYLIGYNFEDKRINEIIRTVRKYHRKIDLSIIHENLDTNHEMIEFLLKRNKYEKNNFVKVCPGLRYAVSNDEKVCICVQSFKDHLESEVKIYANVINKQID